MNRDNTKFSDLNFNFEYKNRIIRTTFENNEYFKIDTPFLKILKPVHLVTNKKKNNEKKYIILEINENYNVNKELDEFLITINKLHETSQENVKKNSLKWFNTEFDEIGLDLKVKKPIDTQKDKQFIKILIPNDNEELSTKINTLEKNDYVLTTIFYKGLKVSNDYLIGEYELINLITQEEFDYIKKEEEEFNKKDLDIDIPDPEQIDNTEIEDFNESNIESSIESSIENNIENSNINNLEYENEEIIENNENLNNEIENNELDKKINQTNIEKKVKKKSNTKEKKDNRFIKFVTRKNKSLVFI